MNKKRQFYYDEVVKVARRNGGRVLSEYYISCQTKMIFECAQGHVFESTPDSVKHNRWFDLKSDGLSGLI
jgi:hypothetical protein